MIHSTMDSMTKGFLWGFGIMFAGIGIGLYLFPAAGFWLIGVGCTIVWLTMELND